MAPRCGYVVSTKPTQRQVDLVSLMGDAADVIRDACGAACDAYAEQYGYPQTDADCEARSTFVHNDPAMKAANAVYNALRDESLAINPHIGVNYSDPLLFGEFSDFYKYETGSRPSTNWTAAEAQEWIDRQCEPAKLAA